MAIDPRQGWVVLGAEVAPGDQSCSAGAIPTAPAPT